MTHNANNVAAKVIMADERYRDDDGEDSMTTIKLLGKDGDMLCGVYCTRKFRK